MSKETSSWTKILSVAVVVLAGVSGHLITRWMDNVDSKESKPAPVAQWVKDRLTQVENKAEASEVKIGDFINKSLEKDTQTQVRLARLEEKAQNQSEQIGAANGKLDKVLDLLMDRSRGNGR